MVALDIDAIRTQAHIVQTQDSWYVLFGNFVCMCVSPSEV